MADDGDLVALGTSPELLRRRTTSDHIADALRQAILEGTLKDGTELNQVALAGHFGVSRVPVREAMRQLRAEGLVRAEAHRRAVVSGLSVDRIVEACDVRALIESHLVEKAIPHIGRADLEHFRALEARMAIAEDHVQWLRLNAEFHAAIYRKSDAPTALEIVDQLQARVERYLNIWSRGEGVHRAAEAGLEHRRILDRIAAGDVEGAREEVYGHVMHTRDRILELYGER